VKILNFSIPSVTIKEVILRQNPILKDVKAAISLTDESARITVALAAADVIVEGCAVWDFQTMAGSLQGATKAAHLETVHFNLPYAWKDEH